MVKSFDLVVELEMKYDISKKFYLKANLFRYSSKCEKNTCEPI